MQGISRLKSQSTARLPFDLQALKEFATDLTQLLKDGTIMEQKAVLRTFVKRIIITPPDVTLEYTVPLLEEKEIGRTTETAVLPMLQIGSPDGIQIQACYGTSPRL